MPADIVPARPSSTVVLVRETDARPEVLMVRRHEDSSFGSAYAFPGGVLEAADANTHARFVGLTAGDADRMLAVRRGGLDYFSAAARELFEETGVLLADRDLDTRTLDSARTGLNAGSLHWDEFLDRHDLSIRCEHLHYFSFWVTPDALPKRYSTRFFLAELPIGQQATHDGAELTDARWMTANEALAAARAGGMSVHLPTRQTLKALARHESIAALCAWARGCADSGVPCIHPAVVGDDHRQRIVLPGDADYPEGTP